MRASIQESHTRAASTSSSEDGWLSPVGARNADFDSLRKRLYRDRLYLVHILALVPCRAGDETSLQAEPADLLDTPPNVGHSAHLSAKPDLAHRGRTPFHGSVAHARRQRQGEAQVRRGLADAKASGDVYNYVLVRQSHPHAPRQNGAHQQ